MILPRNLWLLAVFGLKSSKSLNPLEIHQIFKMKGLCKIKITNECVFLLIYITSKSVLDSAERSVIKPTKSGHTIITEVVHTQKKKLPVA
jgi:hypothetical protein